MIPRYFRSIFEGGVTELRYELRKGGVRLWGSAVSGRRQGRAYANVSDITADPVIAGDVIYTGNQSGRAVAVSRPVRRPKCCSAS